MNTHPNESMDTYSSVPCSFDNIITGIVSASEYGFCAYIYSLETVLIARSIQTDVSPMKPISNILKITPQLLQTLTLNASKNISYPRNDTKNTTHKQSLRN